MGRPRTSVSASCRTSILLRANVCTVPARFRDVTHRRELRVATQDARDDLECLGGTTECEQDARVRVEHLVVGAERSAAQCELDRDECRVRIALALVPRELITGELRELATRAETFLRQE